MKRSPFAFDDEAFLLPPAKVRTELGVSPRWFAYQRKRRRGSPTWEPTERRSRGYRGEIGMWTPTQVARMRAEILAERAAKKNAAAVTDRLGHSRAHVMELRQIAALAWDVVRAAVLGDRLRAIGCDVKLSDIPRSRRARVRAELDRALAVYER